MATRRCPLRQRGVALLIFMIVLVTAALTYVVSNLTPEAVEARRARQTQAVLAQAREALLGYALTYRDRKPDRMYGFLPMPDIGKRGTTQDENCKDASDRPLEGCQAPPSPSDIAKVDGNYLPTLVGRFPWRTLGLPPLRDGHGECLWLIVSAPALSGNAAETTFPFNWDTLGYLDIHAAYGGSALQSILSGNRHDRPWAIVYSPGPALPDQSRAKKANDDDVTECGGNYDARNYLDPYVLEALGGVRNSLANTHLASDDPNDAAARKLIPVKVTAGGRIFKSDNKFFPNACQGSDCELLANDAGLALTGDAIFTAVRKHKHFRTDVNALLDRITSCLQASFTAPTAIPGVAPGDKNAGRLAADACYGDTVPPKGYFGHYQEMLFVAKPTSGNFTVNGNPQCAGALIFAGQRGAGQTRTDAQKNTLVNYLEGINLQHFTGSGTLFSGHEIFERVSTLQSTPQDIVRCIPAGSTPYFVTTSSPGLATAGFPQLVNYSPVSATLTLGQQVHSTLSSTLANFLYGCAWRPETRSLAEGLRTYFTFRIEDPGLYTTAPLDGFTFAIVDGENNDATACGAATQHLGYSGNNTESPFIVAPKVAMEFDLRRQGSIFPSAFNPSHLTNGRNDPPTDSSNYRGGHIALAYWGGETPIAAPALWPCDPPAYLSGGVCTLPQEEDDNVHGQAAPARSGFPAPPPNPAAPLPPKLSLSPGELSGVARLDTSASGTPVNQLFHVRVELTRQAASYNLPRVRVATTAPIDLNTPGSIVGGIHQFEIDGIYLFAGDRVLVKDQADPTQNGIYVWQGADLPMQRATDANSVEALAGLIVAVDQGTTQAGQLWRQETVQPGACANPVECTGFYWLPARVTQSGDLPAAASQPGRIVYVQKGDQANGWFRSDGAVWQRLWADWSSQEAINLASAPATIDGVAPAAGSRILVRHQSNAAENGIYVWNGAGLAMGRATDFDAAPELAGALVQILAGSDIGRAFRQTALPYGGTVGTDAIHWEAIDASPRYLIEAWLLPESPGYTQLIGAMQDTTRSMAFLTAAMNPPVNLPPQLRDTPVIPYPFRNARLGFTIGQRTSINDQTVTIGNFFTTWLF